MEQARRAIRWEIILVIAASLGVSTGMETSAHLVSALCCFYGYITCMQLSCHHTLSGPTTPPHP